MRHGLRLLKAEAGIALVTALLILMSLTTIGLFATNTTIVHQDISANLKASKQGFYLAEAGMVEADNRLGGFVWIGRPGEQLDQIVLRSFQVLNHLEGLILKPFGPTPGSPEHLKHEAYLAKLPHRDWSPHFFPFAQLNGITREEYHDLYRMAAFLNEKVRDRAFDFLDGTLGAQMLRESLRNELWNLEPSPLRLID